MKFCVVTPTRNSLEKLKCCVGSVRGQHNISVDHIIQDAVSSDGTSAWLAIQHGLKWRSEPDTGMYDAINRGWAIASGDILSWLNSDEQYLPGTLEKVELFFEKNPDIDFIYGNALVVNGSGEIIAARREIRLSRRYIANGFLNAFSCTTFFRRRLWDEGILKLDKKFRYAADMDLILRLLVAGKHYAKLDDYLSAFMLDGSNLSCHPKMLDETSQIQSDFGGLSSAALRKIVTAGRYAERLLNGSYRRVDVEYQYALDELPTYRTIVGRAVPGSYQTR